MRLSNRPVGLLVAMTIVSAACTSSETSTTTEANRSLPTTMGEARTPSQPGTSTPLENTSTTQGPATTVKPPTEPTEPTQQVVEYAVVAEERSRRLAIVDPTRACPAGDKCELSPTLTIELSERPHNLTGVGSVVYATHPTAGSISRIDVATRTVTTASAGIEPHDIAYGPSVGALYVADEAGRRLLTVDAESLEVIDEVDLPARPHVLAAAGDAVWITLVGRDELARVEAGGVELFSTAASPHSLIVDRDGLIWFSNWNSEILNVFDPTTGTTVEAPAGVSQPHHFAISPAGDVWVSDNGGGAIFGFTAPPVAVDVGPTPHHLGFVGDILVVAVSGSGQAVLLRDGEVIATAQLTEGLHGIAVVSLPRPPA